MLVIMIVVFLVVSSCVLVLFCFCVVFVMSATLLFMYFIVDLFLVLQDGQHFGREELHVGFGFGVWYVVELEGGGGLEAVEQFLLGLVFVDDLGGCVVDGGVQEVVEEVVVVYALQCFGRVGVRLVVFHVLEVLVYDLVVLEHVFEVCGQVGVVFCYDGVGVFVAVDEVADQRWWRFGCMELVVQLMLLVDLLYAAVLVVVGEQHYGCFELGCCFD